MESQRVACSCCPNSNTSQEMESIRESITRRSAWEDEGTGSRNNLYGVGGLHLAASVKGRKVSGVLTANDTVKQQENTSVTP